MKYKKLILCFFCFLFVSVSALAESLEVLNDKQFLIEQNLRQQETALANTDFSQYIIRHLSAGPATGHAKNTELHDKRLPMVSMRALN